MIFRILAVLTFLASPALSPAMADDAVKGEKVFRKCSSCHQVGPEAENGAGPHLNNLFGRTAGSIDGARYSKAMVAAGEAGLVWNEAELFAYLADPKKYLRARLADDKAKSRKSFRLRKETDRNHVIAYLKTFSAQAE